MTIVLAKNLPSYMDSAAASAEAPQLNVSVFQTMPPTSAMFAAFLGYNPMQTILNSLPQRLTGSLSSSTIATLTGKLFFPSAFAPAFMSTLDIWIYLNATLAFIAAIASVVRGKKYVYGVEPEEAELEEQGDKKIQEHE